MPSWRVWSGDGGVAEQRQHLAESSCSPDGLSVRNVNTDRGNSKIPVKMGKRAMRKLLRPIQQAEWRVRADKAKVMIILEPMSYWEISKMNLLATS